MRRFGCLKWSPNISVANKPQWSVFISGFGENSEWYPLGLKYLPCSIWSDAEATGNDWVGIISYSVFVWCNPTKNNIKYNYYRHLYKNGRENLCRFKIKIVLFKNLLYLPFNSGIEPKSFYSVWQSYNFGSRKVYFYQV